jgi:MFS-type transporter involved in bile tolerance (Atg22 family)
MLSLSFTIMIYGAVIGLSGPSAAYVTDLAPPDKLEISMGLYRLISDSGYFVGPLLLGFVADITATPVPGASHSGLIEIYPFIVASLLLIVAFVILQNAKDPVKNGIQSGNCQ